MTSSHCSMNATASAIRELALGLSRESFVWKERAQERDSPVALCGVMKVGFIETDYVALVQQMSQQRLAAERRPA